MNRRFCLLAFLTLVLRTTAAVIPYGVMNDVSYDTVVNGWGWTVAYRGAFELDNVPIETLFENANEPYVMLAAIQDGSLTFELLAAALRRDVQTFTPLNTTHPANGASWYYNASSMGFAGPADVIVQDAADIGDENSFNMEEDRLSWHTSTGPNYNHSPFVPPTYMMAGYRAGSIKNKNVYDGTWDRLVLTANGTPLHPVPDTAGTLGLLVAVMAGFATWRARRI